MIGCPALVTLHGDCQPLRFPVLLRSWSRLGEALLRKARLPRWWPPPFPWFKAPFWWVKPCETMWNPPVMAGHQLKICLLPRFCCLVTNQFVWFCERSGALSPGNSVLLVKNNQVYLALQVVTMLGSWMAVCCDHNSPGDLRGAFSTFVIPVTVTVSSQSNPLDVHLG